MAQFGHQPPLEYKPLINYPVIMVVTQKPASKIVVSEDFLRKICETASRVAGVRLIIMPLGQLWGRMISTRYLVFTRWHMHR